MSAPFLVGCSGWSYDDWKGIFYPASMRSMLQEYVKVFPTAEINSSFYAMPDEGVVKGWARYSPDGFSFSAKVPQTVTHHKKLKGAGEELEAFCNVMRPLREARKLGPLLLQLPPSLAFNGTVVQDFFAQLPRGFKWALEPREESWLKPAAVSALREAGVCLVAVDEPLLPPDLHLTSDFFYIRWHGHGKRPWYNYEYGAQELKPWVPRIDKAIKEADRGYGFFNNHYHGFGPKNALQLLEMRGALTKEQQAALERIEKSGHAAAKKATLDAFVPQEGVVAKEVEVILSKVTDEGRIERAKQIKGADLALSKVEPHFVRADVHGTRIVMDMTEQRLRHDCIDYLKGMGEKRVCKHVVRLLLALPPEIAREFADDLAKSKADWTFDRYWGTE